MSLWDYDKVARFETRPVNLIISGTQTPVEQLLGSKIKISVGLAFATILILAYFGLNTRVSEIQEVFRAEQLRTAQLLQNELDRAKTNLQTVMETIVTAHELRVKVEEISRISPYFVYVAENYQMPIDHWDRVRIAVNQIWLHQTLYPSVQSNQWDYLGVLLLDPHKNLNKVPPLPYLEIEGGVTKVYSYANKGYVEQVHRFSGKSDLLTRMSQQYFEDVKYKANMGADLYLSLGFEGRHIPINASRSFGDFLGIRLFQEKDQLVLRVQKQVEMPLYNWKTQQPETTPLALFIAEKHFDTSDFKAFQKNWGMAELAVLEGNQVIVSSLELPNTLEVSESQFQWNGEFYDVFTLPYFLEATEHPLQLAVIHPAAILANQLASHYYTVLLTAGFVMLLFFGPLVYFYRLSKQSESESEAPLESDNDTQLPTGNETDPIRENQIPPLSDTPITKAPSPPREESLDSLLAKEESVSANEAIIIEEDGKSLTIHLHQISHIKVTDHYCTIVFQEEAEWKSSMLLKSLKSFEDQYPGAFLNINRSTLVNAECIEHIDWSQRKLIMKGEPERSFNISQSKLKLLSSQKPSV